MAEHKGIEKDNVLDKKAQQLMEDRDAESRTRVFEGTLNKVFTVVLVIWAIFQVWANTFGTLGAVKLRTAHIMFLLPLALMLYPTYKKERRRRRMIPAWDVLLIAAAIASFGYILWRYDALAKTGRLNDTDVLVGVVCLLIVFEAATRAGTNHDSDALVAAVQTIGDLQGCCGTIDFTQGDREPCHDFTPIIYCDGGSKTFAKWEEEGGYDAYLQNTGREK